MSLLESSTVSQPVPYRLRVGVTGHRHLTGEVEIGDRIKEILDSRWIEAFTQQSRPFFNSDHVTQLAFTAISPLAEGADRLVAEAVLESPDGRLEVHLPLPAHEYLQDFAVSESRDRFLTLLARASDVSVSAGDINVSGGDGSRSGAYQQVGRVIVEVSDLLIAIWDGKPSRGPGGTADIIAYAGETGKPVFIISSIVPHDITLLNGNSLSADLFNQLEVYNTTAITRRDTATAINELTPFFSRLEEYRLPVDRQARILDDLLPHFVRANRVATISQNSYQRTGGLAYLVSTFSVAFMAVAVVFAKVPGVAISCYLAEILSLSTLFILIHKAHKAHVHKKWLEFRGLAEQIRCLFSYASCGLVSPMPKEAEDGCSCHWINRVMLELRYKLLEHGKESTRFLPGAPEFLRVAWVQEQRTYHENKYQTSNRQDNRLRQFSLWLFVAAIGVAALHLLAAVLGAGGHEAAPVILLAEHLLTVIAVILPAAAAAVGGYRLLMELSRIASRSNVMVLRLQRLESKFPEIKDSEQLAALLATIESIMLSESRDWQTLMYHADLERIA